MNERVRAWAPVAVCLLLCAWPLVGWPMWNDEVFAWRLAGFPWPKVWDGIERDVHPPLYFLLVAAVGKVHDSDVALRLPSLVCTLAAIPLTRRAVTRLAGGSAGEVAAWMVALNPCAFAMAVSARQYALLLLAGAWVLDAGAGVVQGEKPRRDALALAAAATTTLYTHYAGIAVVAGVGLGGALALLGSREIGRRLPLLVGALALAGLAFVPWALGPLQRQLASLADEVVPRSWDLLDFAWWSADSAAWTNGWVLLALQLGGLALALVRRRPADRLLLGLALVGVAVAWFLSSSPRAARTRNFIDLLPAAAALAGIAVDAVRARWPRVPAAAFALPAVPVFVAQLGRPVPPQVGSTWHDLRFEAAVVDRLIPPDAPLTLRPGHAGTYDRYAPALRARMVGKEAPLQPGSWAFTRTPGRPDAEIGAHFSAACTFDLAFAWPMFAPEPCDAVVAALEETVSTRDYVPFLLELAVRARDAGDLDRAQALAARADARLWGHPEAARRLAEIALQRNDLPTAAAAADRAVEQARVFRKEAVQVGSSLNLRARVEKKLGDDAAAQRDKDAAACTKGDPHPWRCGTWWEMLP